MREVAWVIFDEIHYMRDSGNLNTILHFISVFFEEQRLLPLLNLYFLLKSDIFVHKSFRICFLVNFVK